MKRINQSVKENLTSKLRTLGLSTNSAKTYLALLSQSHASAGFLCKETGVPDSKIYYALDELLKKGMIMVQEGIPKIYKPLHPKEAISSLKQQLVDNLNQKIVQADNLADSLSPMFESFEGNEEVELAYIIRGRRNIIRRMEEIINSATEEVVIFISQKDLLDELSSSIAKANRLVKINFAIPKHFRKTVNLDELGQTKILTCPVNIVISDMKILITVSSWKDEIALMTTDKSLMTMSREYYDNPKCCTGF